MEKGASVDALDDEGAGVLHKAAWSGSVETISALLDTKPALAAQLALGTKIDFIAFFFIARLPLGRILANTSFL